jgi:putative transcriptional regulator
MLIMDKKIFKGILQGAKEALRHAKGEDVKGLRVHHVRVPESVDVKHIRKTLHMTQAAFSETFGFSLDTIKHWESGRRKPERSARILLRVIEKNPAAVLDAAT